MARRTVPADPSIGQRVAARRRLRRWSIRYAASRAGVAHTTWSRIERGQLRTDRYMIAELAAALECAVADLTGQPYTPGDRMLETAQIEAGRVWQTMMGLPLDEPPGVDPPPADVLVQRAGLVAARYGLCDYAGTLAVARELVPGLHAAGTAAAWELAVQVYGSIMGALLNVGHPASAWLAAERCQQAAEQLGQPVPLAVAATNRARVLAYSAAYGPALRGVEHAAAGLDANLGQPAALDLLGFTHLVRAHHATGLRDLPAARAHLAEAAAIAARTGETAAWELAWGPRNVALWTMAHQLDTGQPGEAVETATGIHLGGLPPVRQVYFHLDLARALVDLRRDRAAVRTLLAGERIGPQHVRSSAAGRETARALLHRGADGTELRGLCERMGVA
jgi:transcriptional regulator with XRE-family HTH domain